MPTGSEGAYRTGPAQLSPGSQCLVAALLSSALPSPQLPITLDSRKQTPTNSPGASCALTLPLPSITAPPTQAPPSLLLQLRSLCPAPGPLHSCARCLDHCPGFPYGSSPVILISLKSPLMSTWEVYFYFQWTQGPGSLLGSRVCMPSRAPGTCGKKYWMISC